MIEIVIDTASDMEAVDAQEAGVSLVPMQVRFGDEEFSDGFNLSKKQFYDRLIESDELPQTSQINEYRWAEKLSDVVEKGNEALVITLSSKLSGTYNCAVKAAKKFGKNVRVVDSLNASIGERVLLDYALRIINGGGSLEETAAELDSAKSRVQVLALLDTLKYLKKGGRISTVAAIAGGLLSIKPVISIVKGEVKLVGKAMGSKKGNNLLMQLVEKCGGIDFDMPYALAYSGTNGEVLEKYKTDSEHLWKGRADDIPTYVIGSTIGTHVGPSAIGVSFFAKK